MIILGCDFHPSWQQVNWMDTETGETGEHKLVHVEGEAQRFYQRLSGPALIGMELGALASCSGRDVRIEESWSQFRPNRWLVERSSTQK